MRRITPTGAIGLGILAALLLFSCSPASREAKKEYNSVSPAVVYSLLKGEKAVVVDTMSDLECMDHRIPGSACVPVEEFSDRITGLVKDKNRTLILYCESEKCPRAEIAFHKARAAGFEDVHVLEGGIAGWKKAGYDVETLKRVQRRPVVSVRRSALAGMAAQKKDLFILDIRSEDAYRAGHLEGAVNIPLYTLQRRFKEVPVNRPVLVVDENGKRSFLASCYLINQGYRDVIRLYGGMEYDQPKKGGHPDHD